MSRRRHFLSIEALSHWELFGLLQMAYANWERGQGANDAPYSPTDATLLFYEPSTRTRISFERAMIKLGWSYRTLDAAALSVQKGESLYDTITTLEDLGTQFLILRHPQVGITRELANHVDEDRDRPYKQAPLTIINAGDGDGDHPSQGLVDAFTMLLKSGQVDYRGLTWYQRKPPTLVVLGDSAHSRVAHSTTEAAYLMGMHVKWVGPAWMVDEKAKDFGAWWDADPYEGLDGADFVLVMRPQIERWKLDAQEQAEALADYQAHWCLTPALLAHTRKADTRVLHPGPANRELEIASAVLDSAACLAREQVRHGVPVRQALLTWCRDGRR